MTNNEWIVKEITARRNVVMYTEPYSDVDFVIIMIRRPSHYVMTMLFPCILIGATAAIGELEDTYSVLYFLLRGIFL